MIICVKQFSIPTMQDKVIDMILVTSKQTDALMNRVNTICPFAILRQGHKYQEPFSVFLSLLQFLLLKIFEHLRIDHTSICLAFNIHLLYWWYDPHENMHLPTPKHTHKHPFNELDRKRT